MAELRRRFRTDLEQGRHPRIEDYLEMTGAPQRRFLFQELLSIELHAARKSGQTRAASEYAGRFSEFQDVVHQQFQSLDSFKISQDTTRSFDSQRPHGGHPAPRLTYLESRYRLIEQLGQGGFGEVWRAFDEELQREVAIKGPRHDRPVSPQQAADFLQEARRICQLDVDGVVRVLDVVDECGLCFIVMDLMRGGSVADLAPQGPMEPAAAAALIASTADSLKRIHQRNFVHRDIKPNNILLDGEGRPHISDFGLAASEEELLSEPRSVRGTFQYMPLEQASRRSDVDGRTDIFSLGVVLYQLLTGQLPFRANTLEQYVRRLRSPDGPKPPRQVDERIPIELERVCHRCLQANPADRYATAADLARDLRLWLQSQQERPPRFLRRALIGGAGVAVVASVASIASRFGPTSTVEVHVTPLIFPSSEASSWQVQSSTNSLLVYCDDVSLLSLGEVQDHLQYAVTMRQRKGHEGIGVFLGFQNVTMRGESHISFQTIMLHQTSHGVVVNRAIRNYPQDNPRRQSGEYLGVNEDVTAVLQDGGNVLSFFVEDGCLTRVELNGQELPGLICNEDRNGVARVNCRGRFGACNMNSNCIYSDLTIDGQKPNLVDTREP